MRDASGATLLQTAQSVLMAGEPTLLRESTRRSTSAAFVAFTVACLVTTLLIIVVTLLLPN
jgi:hypothetical protein